MKNTNPIIYVQIPLSLKEVITNNAKKYRRRIQDEFIRSLAASFANETIFTQIDFSDSNSRIIRYGQAVPNELLVRLQQSAKLNGLTLDVEVSRRLFATTMYPLYFNLKTLSEQILKLHFSFQDAIEQSKARRNAWLRLYEIKKFALFNELKPKIPRGFKEQFYTIKKKKL